MVVWNALVVFTMIPPLLEMNRWVSPLVAAAPLALPMLITTTMLGPRVLGPLMPRWWLALWLIKLSRPLCSAVCILLGSVPLATCVLWCNLLISRLSVLVLMLVSSSALLMLL